MSGAPIIDQILTFSITTADTTRPSTGISRVAFLSGDADASLQGKLYIDPAEVTADVTATDLTAQAGVQIKALLAGSPNMGGVYLLVYDGSGGDDPGDALDAGVAASILPGWSYTQIVVQSRVDATIAIASTWAHTNARGRAIVWGALATSSIKSGTVPSGIAASAGADLTLVVFDDDDTHANVETIVGWIAGWQTTRTRPGFAQIRPPGLVAYTAPLTKTQLPLVNGNGSGQARCISIGELYPSDAELVAVQGYTIGATKGEIEYGSVLIQMRVVAETATLVAARARLQNPLRTVPGDASAIEATIGPVFEEFANGGYLERGVAANALTGQPDLPLGYTFTVSFVGSVATATGWLAFPSDVRAFSFPLYAVTT